MFPFGWLLEISKGSLDHNDINFLKYEAKQECPKGC